MDNYNYSLEKEEYSECSRCMRETRDIFLESELTDLEYELYINASFSKYVYLAKKYNTTENAVKQAFFRMNKKINRRIEKLKHARERRERI
ncbi:MAG: hypothetical protein ACRCU6_06780 [Fusobacteriaceae bacterium]